MKNRWQAKLLAGCVLAAVGVGTGACAVAPEDEAIAEATEAAVSATPKVEVKVESRAKRPTAGQLARRLEARQRAPQSVIGGGNGTCKQSDPWEKNDKQADASSLGYEYIWDDGDPECWDWEWCDDNGCYTETDCYESSSAYTSVGGASICKNDEDWYFLPTASLPFHTGYLRLRAFAAGASYCGFYDYGDGTTYGYDPPAAPENTLTVEVYNAQTLALVATSTSPIGRVWMDLYNGTALAQDLYLRFRGPKEAHYSYHFSLAPQTDAFEDECEL